MSYNNKHTEYRMIPDTPPDLTVNTFYITYMFLIAAAIVTSLESLRTQSHVVRHIMILETAIAVIAAYFYSQFVNIVRQSQVEQKEIPYNTINLIRYTDWFITTPIMLFALCVMLAHEGKQSVRVSTLVFILVCNFAMLAVGYAGEIQKLQRNIACIVGFIFFIMIFVTIYTVFLQSKSVSTVAICVFVYFVVVWTMYGLVYLMKEKEKNVTFNVLDMFAKAFVGIFFWVYFAKILIY